MKILQITPYMTNNDVPLLSQCKSGFGNMTYDIAHALAKECEVEVLLINYRYHEFCHDGIRFRANTVVQQLKNLLRCSNPVILLRLWWKYRMKFRTLVRLVYVWMISGFFYNVIKNGKYNIVHIHGCSLYDEILMDICKRAKQQYVITLHGLNSFSDSVTLEPTGKRYERDFLQRVVNGEFPITVISTGIKRVIENTYGVKDCTNIFVVCNSFSFRNMVGLNYDIREKYSIPQKAKIVLYVGNISKNKNQEQMIDVFGLLPVAVKQNTYILFLGRNLIQEYSIDKKIANSQYNKHLILCGNVDKQFMDEYYREADGVVLLSHTEGFGLSLIEGMHFGRPCMTFSDLDAFDDIYNPCAVVALIDRDNNTVANGFMELLQKEWDENAIKQYSNRFESKAMTEKYLNVYHQIQ